MPRQSLIYDRTRADAAQAQSLRTKVANGQATQAEREMFLDGTKGMIVQTDLNRIEEWTAYLVDYLNTYGYFPAYTPHAGGLWVVGDSLPTTEINHIRANVDALRTAFFAIPDWQEITYTASLNFKQVNALEWDMQTCLLWLEAMIEGMQIRRADTMFMIAGGIFNAR